MTKQNQNVQAYQEPQPEADPQTDFSAPALIMNPGAFSNMEKMAAVMASGRGTIPQHLQGNKADCMAIVMQSMQWGMNPFAVAQKTHLTQGGSLGYEAQLVNALVTTNAPVAGRFEYEFVGDWSKILGKVKEMQGKTGGKYYVANWNPNDEQGLGVIVSCTLKGETEPRTVQVLMAQAWPRFSTQWATDPQQQISYLAVRKWARRYTPDVILGVYTADELEESPPITANVDQPKSAAQALNDALDAMPDSSKMPTLEDALAAVHAATTAETLLATRELISTLKGAERKKGIDAYTDKKEQLKRASNPWPEEIVDAEDGSATWVDSTGEFFNQSTHATDENGPLVDQDGVFIKKGNEAKQ